MWPYWLFYALAFVILPERRLAPGARRALWWFVGFFFALAIGLRHQVGGDWYAYLEHFNDASWMTLSDYIGARQDPGYYLLNWLLNRIGCDIYAVNFLCGAFLMSGVIVFSRQQPLPWLALVVSVPYLIIVVGMGYSRQAAALGFAMLGFVALMKGEKWWFLLWIFIAATFHKSALLLLPIVVMVSNRNRLVLILMTILFFGLGWYFFLLESAEYLWLNYIEQQMESQGAAIRVAMNAIPAFLFLVLTNKMQIRVGSFEHRFWRLLSLLSLLCIPFAFMFSTATDRMALYLIPLQSYVFSRLPLVVQEESMRAFMALLIVFYYAMVLFVWLTYSVHAEFWIPYSIP